MNEVRMTGGEEGIIRESAGACAAATTTAAAAAMTVGARQGKVVEQQVQVDSSAERLGCSSESEAAN